MGCNGPGSKPSGYHRQEADRQLDLTRPDAYGRAFADVYDQWYGQGPPVTGAGRPAELTVFVAARCPSGVVLELGVGSGRLAQPLHQAGMAVIGLDASSAMLAGCPPSITRVAGDMADLPFRPHPGGDDGAPGVTVLCGFNTLFNVGSADRLDRLLVSLVELRAIFIVETMNVALLPSQPAVSTGLAPFRSGTGVVVSTTSSDPIGQKLAGRHLEIADHGVASRPWLLQLISHRDLDERAARHGLKLFERYGSWRAEPFSPDDPTVIGVYRPAL